MDLKEAGFCAIDLETTGLDVHHDKIIAFASIPIRHMKIYVSEAYYTLIKPETFRMEAMKYHGISEKDLDHAPSFEQLTARILEALDGIIVGHSVGFDYAFLQERFKKAGIRLKRDVIDIVDIEKWLERKCGHMGPDLTFEALSHRYGLGETYRHNALSDAFYAAQIFQIQVSKLSAFNVDTVAGLTRVVKSCRYASW
jgi:DNA polymerase III epsilon subunit family exonuclease